MAKQKKYKTAAQKKSAAEKTARRARIKTRSKKG